jgi:quercetin dioxygenase-like cupin family protein
LEQFVSTQTIQGPVILRGEGEGGTLTVLGNAITRTVTSDDSGGELMILTYTAPAGLAGPPPHVHAHTDEAFHVLAGTLTMTAGGEVHRADAGGTVFVPRGVAHTFANPDPKAVTMLVIMTPGGFEGYFAELAELVDAGLHVDPDAVAAVQARYDLAPLVAS